MDLIDTRSVQLSSSFPSPVSFFQSCQSQEFSLPKTMLKYVWTNPKSVKGYQKLVKTCKLLFLKNPIIIVNSLFCIKPNGWEICFYDKCIYGCEHLKIDIKYLRSKLWLINYLHIRNVGKIDMDLFYTKLFQCNVKHVYFGNLTLNLNDIKILAHNTEKCVFSLAFVKDENAMDVSFSKLYELLPNIRILHL